MHYLDCFRLRPFAFDVAARQFAPVDEPGNAPLHRFHSVRCLAHMRCGRRARVVHGLRQYILEAAGMTLGWRVHLTHGPSWRMNVMKNR